MEEEKLLQSGATRVCNGLSLSLFVAKRNALWSTHIEQVNPFRAVQDNSHEYSPIREKHPKAHHRRSTQRLLCSEGNCDGCEDPLPKVSATFPIDNK